MFPFKKKPAPAPTTPCPSEQVNRKLDETHTRLEAAVAEMKRRLEEKQRRGSPQLAGAK